MKIMNIVIITACFLKACMYEARLQYEKIAPFKRISDVVFLHMKLAVFYEIQKIFICESFKVFTALGTNLIIIVANMFLWKTAYRGIVSVAEVNEAQMLTYAMISIILASFYSGNVEHTIQDRITQGDIAIDLFSISTRLL